MKDRLATGGRSIAVRLGLSWPDSLPTVAFFAFVAVAAPVILFGLGSYHWFLRDDFMFLTGRDGQWPDLVEPHGGSHWVAIPKLIYLAVWQVFGMRSYVPYQAVVVALHLSVAVLLWVVMRRSGVGTWLAAAAGSLFVLFGPGSQNIVWAFQVSFTGSLAYGLAFLLLTDHDGGFDRRDALGLAFGAAALMSSGVGVTMVGVVALAVLLRRGWRQAALVAAPPAALFVAWMVVASPETSTPFGRPSVAVLARWVRSTVVGTFEGLGRFPVVTVALVAVLVVGTVLVWGPDRQGTLRETRSRLAMVVALAVGSIAFAASSGLGRWWIGEDGARAGRYLYLGAAFTIPLLAVAAQAVAKRWRPLTPVLVVLLLVPIPFNLDDFEGPPFGEGYMAKREEVLTTAVRVPFARAVPSDVQPIPDTYAGDEVNMGFLLSALANGDLEPSTVELTPWALNEYRVRLGVAQRRAEEFPTSCTTVSGDLELTPAAGTRYAITAPVQISTRDRSEPSGPAVVFRPGEGRELEIELDNLRLLVSAAGNARSFELCEY